MAQTGTQETQGGYQSQRIFVASSVTRAMQAVRKEMGDHAVIIQVRKRPGDDSLIEVVASDCAEDDNIAELIPQQPALPSALKQAGLWISEYFDDVLQQRMLNTAECLAQQQPELTPLSLLQQTVVREIPVHDVLERHQAETPVVLMGTAGVGKTGFAMKLALAHRLNGVPLRLINADHKRVGNRHLISHFARLAKIRTHHLQSNGVRKKLEESSEELTIIDTPPLNPFSGEQIAQVLKPYAGQKICRLLVVSLWLDRQLLQDAIDSLAQHTPIDGIIVTGLDCVPAYDKLLNLLLHSGLPLAGASASDAVVDGVVPLNLLRFVEKMVKPQSS